MKNGSVWGPIVAQFCGTNANVVRRTHGEANDQDNIQKALEEYRVEYGVPFTLLYVWRI